jgi:DNA repair exonuclease SbcCD ATPase subunit
MSQNTQIIQDELDEVRTQSLAQEATMLDKLQRALSDVRNHRDENKIRSQLIRDMEAEREAMDKARQELARRSQTLESDLERAEQDYRDLVAHKERLEKEKSATLRQLKDANRREKRHLQLIQDLGAGNSS